MKYWFHDVGNIDDSHILEISMDYAAHVRVMDRNNYNEYRSRRAYKSISKYVTASPFTIKVPRASHWFVVIDLEGKPGVVASEVRVRRGGSSRLMSEVTELPEHEPAVN